MTAAPHRVTFLMTHPVQYLAPWFRWIHANVPELQLTVVYAVQPTPVAQAVGFGAAFEWDDALLAGYTARVLTEGHSNTQIGADRYSRVDVPRLDAALLDSRPDAVIVPGWHAAVYRRAIKICRHRGIPLVYRGDSQLQSGPSGLAHATWRMATRARLAAYSAFLAVGTRSRAYLQANGAPEPLIFASPHCVDNAAFAARARTTSQHDAQVHLGLHPGVFTVVYAGKLQEKKRPLDAIRAIARVPSAQLLIVGSGALEAACRAEAARLGARVMFTGFLNQGDIGRAYAAGDCLVLPSDGRETWGLVVNEAMAAGLPAVVSDAVGCQPDLVIEGQTGAVSRCGDAGSLAAAIERVRQRVSSGHQFAPACLAMVERHSFAAASAGLVHACARLRRAAQMRTDNQGPRTQVVACCGHMVVAGGMERMTFEVLGALRRSGAGVHAMVNQWESSRIVRLAEQGGIDWRPYHCHEPLRRRSSLAGAIRMAVDIARGSWDIISTVVKVRATHVLVPDFLIAVRHWPALLLLRTIGYHVVLRVGMAPAEGAFYGRLWRWVVSPVVDGIVCNSEFLREQVLAHGLPRDKVKLIRNTVATRPPCQTIATAPSRTGRIIYVGQLIPAKGLDLLFEAVARLRREGLDISLDVVGELQGWESPTYRGHRAQLVKRVEADDLIHAVRFLGLREDVPALMAEATVHCCPSRRELREGMAGAVLEAKSAGTPSVVTRSGSLPELVAHGVDGWIADDNVSSLAAGLRHFLQDEHVCAEAGRAALASMSRFDRISFDHAWRSEFGLR